MHMLKRKFILSLLLIFSLTNLAPAVDLSQLFNQVEIELLKKGVAEADINTIKTMVNSLLSSGVNKESIVKTVNDLAALGVKGDFLNKPLQALQDLVKSGEKPNIASNIINLAINQAKAQNLTGKEAISKIIDFINQKKAEFLALKEKAQAKIQAQKDNVNKSLGSILGK